MTEIELKLTAAPGDLPALIQALEAMAKRSSTTASLLTSTYYDSPDLKLRQHHLTLRVREQAAQHVQTVKAGYLMGADLISRGEWEDVIADDQPDLDAPQTGHRLKQKVDKDELRPLFTTIVRRTEIELEPQLSTRIEAAIDEGEIRSTDGKAAEPLSEIELELKSGDPAAIYDVALRLLDVAPLRIETRSKAERGYALVAPDGGRPQALHVKPLTLDAVMTVEGILQRIGQWCLGHLLRNEPAALADQPEGIHQMRVAVRRLRSVLSALKPMLPAEHYRWTSDELRWLAKALGPARNWDVFAANLLEPVERALPLERDLKHLAEAVEQRRRVACDDTKQAILTQQHTAGVLKLARWFEARGWRDQPVSEHAALLLASIGDVAPGLIERRWRQSRKRSKRFDELTSPQRHKLRIALKKLRYTIEALQSLFDKSKVKAFMKLLAPLQDDLGQINDVRTAHELVAEVTKHANENRDTIARAGGIVLGWHDRGLFDQEPRLRKHVRRRREFLTILAGAMALPLAARAQQPTKTARIGFLGPGYSAPNAAKVERLRAGLRDLGWVEGKNIVIEYRWAEGNYDRLPELAAELVRLDVEVLVTFATPGALAANQATTTIPIVVITIADMIRSGLVASLNRPGRNLTGQSYFSPQLHAKRLELLKDALPGNRRVGVLCNMSNLSHPPILEMMALTAKSLGLELQQFEARRPDELTGAFSAMVASSVDAVAVIDEPKWFDHARSIGELLTAQRLPSIGFLELAEAGGLLAYGADQFEMFARSAVFVDKILKGAKPAELPVEQATRFKFVINLKTAKALGLAIPYMLLGRADEVIE